MGLILLIFLVQSGPGPMDPPDDTSQPPTVAPGPQEPDDDTVPPPQIFWV